MKKQKNNYSLPKNEVIITDWRGAPYILKLVKLVIIKS